jgi:hypothetical protein
MVNQSLRIATIWEFGSYPNVGTGRHGRFWVGLVIIGKPTPLSGYSLQVLAEVGVIWH